MQGKLALFLSVLLPFQNAQIPAVFVHARSSSTCRLSRSAGGLHECKIHRRSTPASVALLSAEKSPFVCKFNSICFPRGAADSILNGVLDAQLGFLSNNSISPQSFAVNKRCLLLRSPLVHLSSFLSTWLLSIYLSSRPPQFIWICRVPSYAFI